MITVKNFTKTIRTAALLMSAVLLLAGCSSTDGELPFISLGDDTERVSEYRVIISREASGAVIDRARSFCSQIKEQTGVEALLFYDDESLIYKENSHEIVVGRTSRTVSRVLLKGLRRDDYICAAEGARTVIGGRSDSATVAAIDRFCSEILPAASAERLMHEGGGFSHTGSYPVDKISVFDVELSEYTIEVPSSNDTDALNAAYSLRRLISDKTGYVLDIAVGLEAGRKISLCTVSDGIPENAYIEKTEMGLLLTAREERGLRYISEHLCDLLCSGEAAPLPEKLRLSYGDASLRIGSADFSSMLPFQNIQNVSHTTGVIKSGTSELAFCGIMSDLDRERFLAAMSGSALIEGSKTVILSADGQPATVSPIEHRSENGLTVEIFKIETARIKILLTYVCGNAIADTEISFKSAEGYAPVTLVHTGGSAVEIVDEGGQALIPSATLDRLICYTDESCLDVTVVCVGENYGEFEFFAR